MKNPAPPQLDAARAELRRLVFLANELTDLLGYPVAEDAIVVGRLAHRLRESATEAELLVRLVLEKEHAR